MEIAEIFPRVFTAILIILMPIMLVARLIGTIFSTASRAQIRKNPFLHIGWLIVAIAAVYVFFVFPNVKAKERRKIHMRQAADFALKQFDELSGMPLSSAVGSLARAGDDLLTRERLFAPITSPGLNPDREYVELDLNRDEMNDLVLSESPSLGGTGGLVYNLYISVKNGRFVRLDQFRANSLAVETCCGTKVLWAFSHSSCDSGTIRYWYFDDKGRFRRSQVFEIYMDAEGSAVGNRVYEAIFNEKTMLKMKKIEASSTP